MRATDTQSPRESIMENEHINRQSLVARHNIEWNEAEGQLVLGNGEMAFNCDATGLQTFGGNTMSHWGWHSFPLPPGYTAEDVPPTGTLERGRLKGPQVVPPGREDLYDWMFWNPHRLNLGRLSLRAASGDRIAPEDISGLNRKLDLWTGVHTSRYRLDGVTVAVETCVHPQLDMVAIRIESPLLGTGDLHVCLDFPYPALSQAEPWVGTWESPELHQTTALRSEPQIAVLRRDIDDTRYDVVLCVEGATVEQADKPHTWLVRSAGGAQEISVTCLYTPLPYGLTALPSFSETRQSSPEKWEEFWLSGGAIDLSKSPHPRWMELERRIVLSQYLLAAQSAGSLPTAEAGLMGLDDWAGQFHMEMIWWHVAHYALWGRWGMAEEAVGFYERIKPVSRALAEQLDYQGVMWPKMTSPEGRNAPWVGHYILLWRQPHPIFLAELEYRERPTPETLTRWGDIVFETADFMADYATRDELTGFYSLSPVMPVSELGVFEDTVFELAYWRFGLAKAQEWRTRLGLEKDSHWDEVLNNLAPLPTQDGVYLRRPGHVATYTEETYEHPDTIGVLGMLPPVDGVDIDTARRTVTKVWETWNWDRCWGWDLPWFAMAAARVGESAIAVESLLSESWCNQFDMRGVNTGGPCPYLPGNGGLLYAVAMMSAGWDGCPERDAPGFPDDGSWVVKWEGLRPAP